MQMRNDENGFVLVTALIILVVLTIIGIAATTNTSLELQIAGNDKVHKETFYGAEGAAILGAELLEQNLNCPTGFADGDIEATNAITVADTSLDFARNDILQTEDFAGTGTLETDEKVFFDDNNADIKFPLDYDTSNTPNTYLRIGGAATMLPGGSLQMAAGYEGAGKSAAGAGVARFYDIYSRHQGKSNSQAILVLGWRHVVGSEATCNY